VLTVDAVNSEPSATGFPAFPQKINFLVEQAGKPVHKRLIDNGATYEFISFPVTPE
jgi:hypothetical protein